MTVERLVCNKLVFIDWLQIEFGFDKDGKYLGRRNFHQIIAAFGMLKGTPYGQGFFRRDLGVPTRCV